MKSKAKIGVIGCGVVGKATLEGFERRGIPATGWDKFNKEYNDLEGVLNSDVIFICVPTPTNMETGDQDLNPLIETFQLLRDRSFPGVIAVKSTVIPGITWKLAFGYGFESQVVHNPEFLTAAQPLQDFLNQSDIIIGGPRTPAMLLTFVYREAGFSDVHVFARSEDSELIKYMHNIFLSMKVSLLNDMAEACSVMGRNYSDLIYAATCLGGIGRGHVKVPGPDGKFGFGGMCFPKDTSAFLKFAKDNGISHGILEAAVEANKLRRPELYQTPTPETP